MLFPHSQLLRMINISLTDICRLSNLGRFSIKNLMPAMKTYKVIVSKAAVLDLDSISSYVASLYRPKSGRHIAQCEQLPAALTQGDTEEEALENLQDAIDLILKTEKEEIA